MIAQKYVDLLSKAGRSSENQIIYFPYPVTGIQGLVSQVSQVYGNTNVSAMNITSSGLASFQESVSKEFANLDSLEEKQVPSDKGKEEAFSDLN